MVTKSAKCDEPRLARAAYEYDASRASQDDAQALPRRRRRGPALPLLDPRALPSVPSVLPRVNLSSSSLELEHPAGTLHAGRVLDVLKEGVRGRPTKTPRRSVAPRAPPPSPPPAKRDAADEALRGDAPRAPLRDIPLDPACPSSPSSSGEVSFSFASFSALRLRLRLRRLRRGDELVQRPPRREQRPYAGVAAAATTASSPGATAGPRDPEEPFFSGRGGGGGGGSQRRAQKRRLRATAAASAARAPPRPAASRNAPRTLANAAAPPPPRAADERVGERVPALAHARTRTTRGRARRQRPGRRFAAAAPIPHRAHAAVAAASLRRERRPTTARSGATSPRAPRSTRARAAAARRRAAAPTLRARRILRAPRRRLGEGCHPFRASPQGPRDGDVQPDRGRERRAIHAIVAGSFSSSSTSMIGRERGSGLADGVQTR